MNRRIEILAPAGSRESLKAAVYAGADAVYAGGTRFGARAFATNLSEEELKEAIDYVHVHGRRIYLTVNTLLKDSEMDELYEYLLPYYIRGLDGVIVQDMGVISYIKEHFPKLPIHASTQMTIAGTAGAGFLREQGIARVVLARELSLLEIRNIKEKTGLEMECFIHGALCYCYSGQCLMSSMIGGRSGNRGQCAQPCRLPYSVEGGKTGDFMSLKDLCTIDLLPELIQAGVDSLKIEGRMKQPAYVYTVVSIYRKYVDLYLAGKYEKVSDRDREKLLSAYQRRGYSEGYYRQHNGKDMISFARPKAEKEEAPLPEEKLQEKINGKLTLSCGQSAKLLLEYNGHTVICHGDAPQAAMRQPLDGERVARQMKKTGNTEFAFDRFEVEMEEGLFLPMQSLNKLRRESICKLSEAVLKPYQREVPEYVKENKRDGIPFCQREKPQLSVLVQTQEQFETALGCEEVEIIYVDSIIGMKKEMTAQIQREKRGKSYYFAMPYIVRDSLAASFENAYALIQKVYDGILIRNWESYQWLRGHSYDRDIRSDYNLYVLNRYAKAYVKKLGIRRFTAPVELNDRELEALGIEGETFIAYGYQPVMITAGCIQKTTGVCRHKEGYMYVKDRFQKKFAVKKCCPYCYNILYNYAPLYLADKRDEVMRLAPGELRLDFTTETAERTGEIIRLYAKAFLERCQVLALDTEYTRGHFKRGVK